MTENPAGSLPQKQEQRKWLLWGLRAVPAALLVAFICMNLQRVQVKFLLWDVHTSLIWALITAAGLGFTLGFFAHRMKK